MSTPDGAEVKIDIEKLRRLCVTKHGLVNDQLRHKVWPILLNVESIINEIQEGVKDNIIDVKNLSSDTSWQKQGKLKHRESDQIAKDVNRSLNTFDLCRQYDKSTKMVRRQELSKIIHAILNKNDDLHYYQGFHDFVSVFLLTLGENLGFHCCNIASNYYIRDYMYPSFETGVFPALDLTNKLI